MEVAKDHFWFDWTQYTARRQIAGFIWFHHLRETWKKQRGDSSSDTSMPDVKRASWRKFQSRRNYFSALKKTHLFLLLIYIWVIIYIYIYINIRTVCVEESSPQKTHVPVFSVQKSLSLKKRQTSQVGRGASRTWSWLTIGQHGRWEGRACRWYPRTPGTATFKGNPKLWRISFVLYLV